VTFDANILKGMQTLSQANSLKRTLLGVLSPIATAAEVSRWAAEFETLDTKKTGVVSVKDLAERLVTMSGCSEKEAKNIAEGMGALDANPHDVSYSAFLTACLTSHMVLLKQSELETLFQRLDNDNDGYISVDEVKEALGDAVDLSDMRDVVGDRVNFSDLLWMLRGPCAGPANISGQGLQQLIHASKASNAWKMNRVKSGGKAETQEQIEAARKENMAKRAWHTMSPEVDMSEQDAENNAEVTCSFPMPMEETQLSAAASELRQTIDKDPVDTWATATAAAKTGDFQDMRQENMAWRLMHMESKGSST